MLSSGHHESWPFHKGCVSLHSSQTAILPHVGTLTSAYWAFPLSISIHLRKRFGCSMKFFQFKITLGLALGESWPLLAQRQKNTDVYKGLLLWEGFPGKTWIRQFVISLARSLCHGNEHHGIDPNMLSSGPSWLFHKGCLSLRSWQTAMLAHVAM